MASLLKQVLTLLGHAAGDAAGDALDRALKPATTVGGPGTAAGPAEGDPAPGAPRRSANATARQAAPTASRTTRSTGPTAPHGPGRAHEGLAVTPATARPTGARPTSSSRATRASSETAAPGAGGQGAHRTTQAGGRGAPPGRTSRGAGARTGAHEGVTVYDVAARGLPDFTYSPDPDGEADPGEVVWTWVPYEEDASQGKDRPVLVLARQGTGPSARLVVSQMTSQDHDLDAAQEAHWGRYWHDVGTGAWDSQGRPSEVRLDRLLLVSPEAVRREGATMDKRTFDGVVSALREHWG